MTSKLDVPAGMAVSLSNARCWVRVTFVARWGSCSTGFALSAREIDCFERWESNTPGDTQVTLLAASHGLP